MAYGHFNERVIECKRCRLIRSFRGECDEEIERWKIQHFADHQKADTVAKLKEMSSAALKGVRALETFGLRASELGASLANIRGEPFQTPHYPLLPMDGGVFERSTNVTRYPMTWQQFEEMVRGHMANECGIPNPNSVRKIDIGFHERRDRYAYREETDGPNRYSSIVTIRCIDFRVTLWNSYDCHKEYEMVSMDEKSAMESVGEAIKLWAETINAVQTIIEIPFLRWFNSHTCIDMFWARVWEASIFFWPVINGALTPESFIERFVPKILARVNNPTSGSYENPT